MHHDTQDVQQSAIDEYEALLAEALTESEELHAQVWHPPVNSQTMHAYHIVMLLYCG